MFDARHTSAGAFRAIVPDPLPVARLLTGRTAEEVAEAMPRIFNLCPVAQATAIRLALGMKMPDPEALAREIANEHVLRLTVFLPARLGLSVPPASGQRSADAPFEGGPFPATPAEFDDFLQDGSPLAHLLCAVRARFARHEAVTDVLPAVSEDTALAPVAVENSVAARHIDHPVLRYIEASFGRGPLWRVTARAIDLEAALAGRVPPARRVAPGMAVVPAARGLYAIEARTRDGRVTRLRRVTPTDHMFAPGGIFAQSLASLPGTDHDRAGLVAEILDPCIPVRLERAQHA